MIKKLVTASPLFGDLGMVSTPVRAVLGSIDGNATPNHRFQSPAVCKRTPRTPLASSSPYSLAFSAEKPTLNTRIAFDRYSLEKTGKWTLDDFTCIRMLGKGGTASVFLARCKETSHLVALKVLKYDEEESYECHNEVDIHIGLVHKHILSLVDYFTSHEALPQMDDTSEQYMYIILELCEGPSLLDMVEDSQDGRLQECKAASLFAQILDAFDYIHDEARVIHCDVKAANILVHHDNVKIADFGMSIRRDDQIKEILGGTPIFMAPEHLLAWRNFFGDFDHRADIYSLGVVLFFILVGYEPFLILEGDDDSIQSLLDDQFRFPMDDEGTYAAPVLDLRDIDDPESDDVFVTTYPEPNFPECIAEDARELIRGLMAPRVEERLTLQEARSHPWLVRNL